MGRAQQIKAEQACQKSEGCFRYAVPAPGCVFISTTPHVHCNPPLSPPLQSQRTSTTTLFPPCMCPPGPRRHDGRGAVHVAPDELAGTRVGLYSGGEQRPGRRGRGRQRSGRAPWPRPCPWLQGRRRRCVRGSSAAQHRRRLLADRRLCVWQGEVRRGFSGRLDEQISCARPSLRTAAASDAAASGAFQNPCDGHPTGCMHHPWVPIQHRQVGRQAAQQRIAVRRASAESRRGKARQVGAWRGSP